MYAHVDPSCVGQVHVALDGDLQRLELRVNDPEVMTLAMLDWLTITDHDALIGFVLKGEADNAFATHVAQIDDTAVRAKQAKAVGKGAPVGTSEQKRANTAAEISRQKTEQLGLGDAPKPVQVPDDEFVDRYAMLGDEAGSA